MDIRDDATIRSASAEDVDKLARLWFDGWQDAHAKILPAELRHARTLERFRERLIAALPEVRTAGPVGDPAGLAIVKDDELYQLYVSPAARGTGLSARLTADALSRIRANGHRVAWLACAIGNDRAARFYEKTGWVRRRVMTSRLPTPDGVFSLDVWRYEISL
jgi:GNAT superfamily N-acetyltransferase